jgi:peptidoglycan hydrolase-like protein with peptidoglycan-binding domain
MNSGPTLAIGSTGPDVRRVQVLFVMMKELLFSDIDGNFGPNTQDLVKSFQEGNNLTPDGVVGPATWNAFPADPNTQEVKRGSTGAVVSALQNGLKRFDDPNTPTDPGPIDGKFGERTESAVRSNGPKNYSRRSCWRSDVVGSCRWSRGHAGEFSGSRHSLRYVRR